MTTQPRIKKVLLINPPSKVYIYPDGSPAHRKHCMPPLGLAYLAAGLLNSGYEVEVLDALAAGYDQERFIPPFLHYGLTNDAILEAVERARPDVIGISVLFSSIYTEVVALSRELKQAFPDTPIVLGGQHPTGAPRAVMENPDFDFVLIGEADYTLPLLMDALAGKRPLDSVPSLYYRQDGQVLSTMDGKRRAVEGNGWAYYSRGDMGNPTDLDKLPLPAWQIFDMSLYWKSDVRIGGGDVVAERYAVMVSTRGCPHACYFCTSPLLSGYKGYRKRSNDHVMAEIRWLRDQFGVQEIEFLDDNFFVSKPRVKELLAAMAAEFPDMAFGVPGGTEVNALDEEVIDLMAKANFYKCSLAIEAGDPELQKAVIDKKVDVHRVPQIVEYLKSRNIETRAMFMIGFPHETRAQIDKTIALARTLAVDDFYISLATPLPGTPLYDECLEKGLFVDGYDLNSIRYSVGAIKLPDTSTEEVENIRRTVWREVFEEKRRKMTAMNAESRLRRFTDAAEYERAGFKTLANPMGGGGC